MKRFKDSAVAALLMLSVILLSGCAVYTESVPATVVTYENPQWAPSYISGARYYYLPDIECYYDLSGGGFVFLNNGQWRFSRNIGVIYPDFDLNRCYSIVLDINVYRPWMHHQHYVSHYPRYYYRDYYDRSNIPYVRGYNENSRSAIYWSGNERDRAREWNDQNLRDNRQFKYSDSDRQMQSETSRTMNSQRQSNATTGRSTSATNTDRRGTNTTTGNRQDQNNTNTRSSATTNSNESTRSANTGNAATRSNGATTTTGESRSGRAAENATTRSTRDSNTTQTTRRQSNTSNTAVEKEDDTNYYGKTIGQPVKVEKQMRNQTETPARRSTTTGRSTTTTTTTSTGRATTSGSTSTGRSTATEKSNTSTSRSGRR